MVFSSAWIRLHCGLFCTVLAGTVITTVTRGGSLHATVSIISIYREGNLAIQQAGKNMSVKLTVVCRQCPLLRRGKDGAVAFLLGKLREAERGRRRERLLWGSEIRLKHFWQGRKPLTMNMKKKENQLSLLSLSSGLNYIIMGQVGEDGRGKIMPNSFVKMFKNKNQRPMNALKNKQC